MPTRIDRVHVRNFRSLADVDVALDPVNVLFGRNGAGKSTFLDTVWFARDCAARGVELASSARSHGIGLLYDGAPPDARVDVALSSGLVTYELKFGIASGRIDPFPGELLTVEGKKDPLISRAPGSEKVGFWHEKFDAMSVTLREPSKLSLARYADLGSALEAETMDRVLRFVRFYDARKFYLHTIKIKGSEAGFETNLWSTGENLWSVLRNLSGKASVDDRYDTILGYMRDAFPSSFEDLVLESTGPTTVYGSFLEKWRRAPILASGVSDGHLQMLILLTALFSEGPDRGSLILFDEPEISLHPWAIAVLASAMREAAASWEKQILLATHAPALLSQFEPNEILLAEMFEGRTRFQRLSEKSEVQDLLSEFSVGSLYMSEAVASQHDLTEPTPKEAPADGN